MANRARTNLLVITTDGSVRAVLSRFLRSRGFTVKTAAGLDEARTIGARWRPDVVVLEARGPEGGHFETLRELRESAPALAGVPVLLGCKTALKRAADAEARELGVAEVVIDPFAHMNELVKGVEKVLSTLDAAPASDAALPSVERARPEPQEPERAAEAGPEEAIELPLGAGPASGRLADTSVAELLHRCHEAGASGRLTLRRGATEVAITVDKGAPCHASSSDPEDSLLAFLERSGRLGSDACRVVREACAESGAAPRQVIFERKLLGPHDLFRALASHLREQVVGCVAWEDGEFAFRHGVGCDCDATPIGLDASTLIRAGIERHYDLERLERVVVAPDETRLNVRERGARGVGRDALCLSTLEARLFELASREATIGEICTAAGGRLAGLRFLHALLVMEVLGLERHDPPEKGAAASEEGAEVSPSPPPRTGEIDLGSEPDEPLELAGPLPGAAPLELPETLELADEPGAATPEADEVGIEQQIAGLAEANFFELFGLARDAATEEVHDAFRRMAARFRPEALADLPGPVRDEGIAVYQRMLEGYRVLANAKQREAYTLSLARGGARPVVRRAPAERRAPEPEEAVPEPRDRLERLIAAVERALAKSETSDAIRMLRDAKKEHSDSARWIAWYGWALYRDAPELNLHEAERFLGRARAQAPSHPEPYLLMARLRVREGATERARELYCKALSLDPGAAVIERELDALDAEPACSERAETPEPAAKHAAGSLSSRGRELMGILKRLPFVKKS